MLRPLFLLILTLLTTVAVAETPPHNVTAADANAHITQRVEPTFPALAKTMRIGGTVTLRIVISTTGDVSSVKVLSGHPMLVSAAIEAVKQWKYRPFLENGNPIAVTTDVQVEFPGGMSEKESDVRNRLFTAEDKCRDLINSGRYADAERKCREAVELSNELPKDIVLERSTARALLANSIFLQGRANDAIPLYQEALDLDKGYRKPNDADLATDYQNLGRAYGVVGRLAEADSSYAISVSTYEAAIQDLPSMKDNYTRRLRRALNEYAQLKDAEGQAREAEELRSKAASR